MNFEAVFSLLIENFQKAGVNFALIGGFALHVAGYSRATQDIDFLAAKEDMPKVKTLMLAYGYDLIHESEDVSNFAGKLAELGRVDFVHAHRKYANAMLVRAQNKEVLGGSFKVKVVTPEDLIGLKVQSSSNNPARFHQDMADIESVIRANQKNMDMDLVREYFDLFGRTEELRKILAGL